MKVVYVVVVVVGESVKLLVAFAATWHDMICGVAYGGPGDGIGRVIVPTSLSALWGY